MSSRERILQRLRNARDAHSSDAPDSMLSESGWPKPEPDQWLSVFKQNLQDNHADVIETDEQGWCSTVTGVLQAKGVQTLRTGDNPDAQQLLTAVAGNLNAEAVTQVMAKTELFNGVDAGFSVAMAGLAETGSLVVQTGPQEPRTLSLVPPLNIVLLRASKLVANFSQLVSLGRMPDVMPTNLLLISGPSKTADIQQTLAYGAHGPKELVVVLVMDI